MNKPNHDDLVQAAIAARAHAHAPYSNFSVGAALRAADGSIHAGCNVENASYGLTICAERVAIAGAVARGHRSFEAIAIAADGAVSPCGACLQVLAEFCEGLTIVMSDADGHNVRASTLDKMLPDRFVR